MELTAALKALESLEQPSKVELFTDSRYLQQGVSSWLFKWEANGWRTSDGLPVKNRDLWQQFSIQFNRHDITWSWIKGHSSNKWNDRADELAVLARKSNDKSNFSPDHDGVHLYAGVTWSHKTGSGGYAVILRYNRHLKVLGGVLEHTTANRLYLHGVIKGVETLKRAVPVYVYTRSGYLRDGLETWIHGWRKRNWRTREGEKISNIDQWQELAAYKDRYNLHVIKVSDAEPICHLLEAKELARELS